MKKYSLNTINEVRRLRLLGHTYSEICYKLNIKIPKSTISGFCKNIKLSSDYYNKVKNINLRNLFKARQIAVSTNKKKKQIYLKKIKISNTHCAEKIDDPNTAKIALAMLCLGEASKSTSGGKNFFLGSSDPKIIILFIELLKKCFDFNIDKVRCTVQCRADQNISELERYWQSISKIPKRLFYKSRIDPRTAGKRTLRTNYKGVLRVDYFDRSIQLELETLADLVYNQILKGLVA